jgi:hypothetical protein
LLTFNFIRLALRHPRTQCLLFWGLSSPLCSKLMVGRVITVDNTN